VVDVGRVAIVEFIGQAIFRAERGLGKRGDDFLEGIGIVAEALAKLAVGF
jgi:hypothetical protein